MPSSRAILAVVICILLLPFLAPVFEATPLPPHLRINAPQQGDFVSGDLVIDFTSSDFSDHRVELRVDGQLRNASISSPHTISGLEDGSRIVTLTAINSHGLQNQRSVHVNMDSTAPVIDIHSPLEGNVYERSLDLNWTLDEENPLRTEYRIDDGDWLLIEGNTTLQLQEDGPFTIQMRSLDEAGNIGTQEVNFTVDTGMPAVRFISPDRNSYHNTPDLTVNWTAFNYDALSFSLDGGGWQVADDDGVELLGLDNGRHTITLRAENSTTSSTASRTLPFYIDDVSPVVHIISPLTGMRHGSSTAMLIWDVVSDSPFTTDIAIDVEGQWVNHTEVEGTSLRLKGLPAGTANLNLTVNDAAGNSMWADVSFETGVKGLPMGALSISNEDSLRNIAATLDLPGNGSATNPWVLENIGIDAQGADRAVSISHTSKHLVLNNLSLFNTRIIDGLPQGTAVLLRDVKNIEITGVIAQDNLYGVRSVSMADQVSIIGNDLRNSHRGAVTIEQAHGLTISGNDLRDAGRWAVNVGWDLTETRDVNVTDNDCRGHQRYGIALERVVDGEVSNNAVTTTAGHETVGIYLFNSVTRTTIADNDCRHNFQGILSRGGAFDNVIRDNDCRNNTHGIEIADRSEENLITGNDCRENPYGIFLYDAYRNNVSLNHCYQTDSSQGVGIRIEGGEENKIWNNNASNNLNGIEVIHSNDNNVSMNDCSQTNNSQGVGVYVRGGIGNDIWNNNASHNHIGIYLHFASSQNVIANDCSFAGKHAIFVNYSLWRHTIAHNDCRHATEDALRMDLNDIDSSAHIHSNNITANDLRHNGGSAINITGGANSSFFNNQIQGNDCRNSTYDLINIFAGNYSYSGFRDNILTDAPMRTINLSSSDLDFHFFRSIQIIGNLMSNSSTDGFRLHGNLSSISIIGNKADNASHDGINITDSRSGMRDVVIDGNDVSDPGGDGIFLRSNMTMEGGSVSSNLVQRVPGNPIQVLSTTLTDFNIDDNIADDHPGVPALVVTALSLQEVSISGNDLRDCGAGLILEDRDFLNVTISGNDLRGCPGTLIAITSTSEAYGLHVDGNDLRRVGGQGIRVDVNGLRNSTFNSNDLTLLVDEPLSIVTPYVRYVSVDMNICPGAADNGIDIQTSSVYDLSISGNDLSGSLGDALRLHTVSADILNISSNDLSGASRDGVSVTTDGDMNHTRLQDNDVRDIGRDAMTLTAGGDIHVCWVEDNLMESAEMTLTLRAERVLWLSVERNEMRDANVRPILLDTDHLDSIYIRDNDARNSLGPGVEMNGTFVQDIWVLYNDLSQSSDTPVRISSGNDLVGIMVEGNNVSGASDHAVVVTTSSDIRDLSITGNTALGNLMERMIVSCDGLTNATVSNNTAPGAAMGALHIDCRVIDGLRVEGNILHSSGTNGLRLDPDTLSDAIIKDNQLQDAVGDSIRISVGGAMQDLIIDGNDLSGSGGDGMVLQADGILRMTIHGNDVRNSVGDPVIITSDSLNDVNISSNLCPDARGTPVILTVLSIGNLSMVSNDLSGSGSHGVVVQSPTIWDVRVIDNDISDSAGDAVRIISDGTLERITIEGNHAPRSAGDGIMIQGPSLIDIVVRGNNLHQAGGDAVRLMSDGDVSDLTVEDNVCTMAVRDGIHLTIGSGSLSESLISKNDMTDVGRYPIHIDAGQLRDTTIIENHCQDATLPLLILTDEVLRLRIEGNDLSGSGGEALRLEATIDTLWVIGNDMSDSQDDSLHIIALGEMVDVTVLNNTISSSDGNGIRIDAGSLLRLDIGNNTVTASHHPIWLSADSSRSMTITENRLTDAVSQPLRLEIPILEEGSIDGNDLSRSVSGILISTQMIEGLTISYNNLTDCGGGIGVNADVSITTLLISDNILEGVPGMAISVHCDESITALDILGNRGGTDGIIITSAMLEHGNISGNDLNGDLNVDVTGSLVLEGVDSNVLSGGMVLNAAHAILLSVQDNIALDIEVGTSGSMRLDQLSGNQFPSGVNLSSGADCTVGSMASNSLGPTLISAASVHISSFNDNNISSPAIGVEVQGGDVTILDMSQNLIQECHDLAFKVVGDDVYLERFQGNELAGGSPTGLLWVEADDVSLRMEENLMSVASVDDAVRIVSDTSLDAHLEDNTLLGAVNLSAPSCLVTLIHNDIGGPVHMTGSQVGLPKVEDNIMDSMHVEASTEIDSDLFRGNTMGGLTMLSDGDIAISVLSDNTLTGHMMLSAGGDLAIGEMAENNLASVHLDASRDLSLDLMEFNGLNTNDRRAMEIEAGRDVDMGTVYANVFSTTAALPSLTISSEGLRIGSMEDNHLITSYDVAMHIDVSEDLEVQSLRSNVLIGSLSLEVGDDAALPEISANTMTHLNLQAGTASLNLTDNILTGDVVISVQGSLVMEVMTGNQLMGMLSEASTIGFGVVNGNTLTGDMELQAGSGITIDGISANSMADLTANSSTISVGDVSGNVLVGNMTLTGEAGVTTGDLEGNELRSLRILDDVSIDVRSIVDNIFQDVDGAAIMLQAETVVLGGLQDNQLVSGSPTHLLLIEGDVVTVEDVSSNSVTVPTSSDAVRMVSSGGLTVGAVSSNSLQGGMVLIGGNDLVCGELIANTLTEIHMEAGGVSTGDVHSNNLDGRLTVISSEGMSIPSIRNNDLRGLDLSATVSLMVSEIDSNRFHAVTGDTISIQSSEVSIPLIIGNQVESGVPDRFLHIQCGSFGSSDVSGNTMDAASIEEAVRISATVSVDIGIFSGNTLNGILNITAPSVVLDSWEGNELQGMEIDSTSTVIGDMADNTLGHVSIVTTEGCSIGAVEGNTMDSLQIHAADLTIGVLRDNGLAGRIELISSHLDMGEGVLGNDFGDGIEIMSTSAEALRFQGNLIGSTGHGIHVDISDGSSIHSQDNQLTAVGDGLRLITDGIMTLVSSNDNITAGLKALNLEAHVAEVTITNLTVPSSADGVKVQATAITIHVQESHLNADGAGVHLIGPSVLRLSDSILEAEDRGVKADQNLEVEVTGSVVRGSASVGIEATGGKVSITDSSFDGNGVAIVLDSATEVIFIDNLVQDSQGDGLVMMGCQDILVRGNDFHDNGGFAINATACSDMVAVWNAFFSNNGATLVRQEANLQCHDDNDNVWNMSRFPGSGGMEGNYWSDWQSPDDNEDGIVDIPYEMSGGAIDHHPLKGLVDDYPPHVAIESPVDGDMFSYDTIELRWEAMDNRSGMSQEDVRVLIDGQEVYSLPHGTGSLDIDPLTLAEGWRNITVSVRDNDGNEGNATVTILIDRTPPEIVVLHPGEDEVLQTPFDLVWETTDDHDLSPRSDISINGGDWIEDVSSPYQIDGLIDGRHDVSIRAVDHLGNENVTIISFIVDNTPPVVEIIEPSTGTYTNSSEVLISWTIEDENPDLEEISVDGVEWFLVEGSTTFILSDGVYTILVRATDLAGNVNQSNITVTVDTRPPDLSIDYPDDGDYLDSGDVLLEFDATDINLDMVEVSSDGDVWVAPDHDGSHLFGDLADGEHTLYLRAVDLAGNVNVTSITVVVDTEDPELSIHSPDDGYHSNSSSVLVEWTAIDASPMVEEVSTDGSSWAVAMEEGRHVFELAEDEHRLWVRVTDAAGNVNVTSINVTVDLTPPEVSITSPEDGIYNSTGSVTLVWEVIELNDWTAEVSVDGGDWMPLGQTFGHELTGLPEGELSFMVRVTDLAGNQGHDSITVHVDLTDPIISITSHEDGDLIPEDQLTLEWEVIDDSPVTINVSYDGDLWLESGPDGYTFTDLDEGVNVLLVRAIDAAGNVNVTTISVTVDTEEPQLTITHPEQGYSSDTDSITVEWDAFDESPFTAEISYDGETWEDADDLLSHTFQLQEGENTLWVKVTDAAGWTNISDVTVNYNTPNPTVASGSDTSDDQAYAVAAAGALGLGGGYILLRSRRPL